MTAATLFNPDRLTRRIGEKREALMTLIAGGFDAEVPQVAAPPRPGGQQTRESGMTRGHYLRRLDELIQRTETAEIDRTLVSVSPEEIQALVEKTAKAKARYLANALDTASGETLPDPIAIEELETARQRHEALEAALRTLLSELRRGHVEIKGVREDTAEVASES